MGVLECEPRSAGGQSSVSLAKDSVIATEWARCQWRRMGDSQGGIQMAGVLQSVFNSFPQIYSTPHLHDCSVFLTASVKGLFLMLYSLSLTSQLVSCQPSTLCSTTWGLIMFHSVTLPVNIYVPYLKLWNTACKQCYVLLEMCMRNPQIWQKEA